MLQFATRGNVTRRRSVLKAITWRGVALVDTLLIGYLVTGNWLWAGSIASLEILTKMFLYYLHERAWAHVEWGMRAKVPARE
ncbi:MAG: DUF2061 domain-containing protein [Rhodospirillales bacterium]|nr:DUF2061 domain-containing protein [Rhodospirillales bacterium]